MKKIFSLSLVALLFAPFQVNAKDLLCNRVTAGGCNLALQCKYWCSLNVEGDSSGWRMSIECSDGMSGSWSGTGAWGGDC